MTEYFAGNGLDAFSRSGLSVQEITTAGRFDSTYVASAIGFTVLDAEFIASAAFSATGTVWVRFDFYVVGGSSALTTAFYLQAMNGSTGVFRIRPAGGSSQVFMCEYWNGSAWTATGSSWTPTINTLRKFALKITLNSGFELYDNNTLVASGSSWSGGQTTMTTVQFSSGRNANGFAVSQVMIADYDLRDAHLMAAAINGDSASNTGAASGVYTDVNETTLNDGTAILVDTSGNKAGQTKAGITVPTGYMISAMVVSARGRVSGGSVTDGKLGARGSSGTNSSGSGRSFNSGYEPRQRIVTTDPDTGAAFTQSGFNASEPYLEAS